MRERSFAIIASIALSTILLMGLPMARAAGADDVSSELARATDFRLASGFAADDAYVRGSLSDSNAFPSTDYGVR